MPYTANEEYSKPLKVMPGRKAIKDLDIAVIAGSSAKMKDPERFFKTVTFKTHDVKLLVAKSNQYKCNNSQQVHPYQEETYSLFYLNSGIGIPDKGKQKNYSQNL